MSDLVDRLRVLQDDLPYSAIEFAADRIEALEAEVAEAVREKIEWADKWREVVAQLTEARAGEDDLAERLRYADDFIRSELGGLRNPARTAALASHAKRKEGR